MELTPFLVYNNYMLDKIKKFINEQTVNAPPVVPQTTEEKIVDKFSIYVENLPEGTPIRAKEVLVDLVRILKEIDFPSMSIIHQAHIRKLIESDISHLIDIYLTLPKSHAVSIILDNGKTAKDTLILKLIDLSKQIQATWDKAVLENTQSLMKKQHSKIHVAKKDFFDL